MFASKTGESVGTDRWCDVVVDVPLVAACDRWAQLASAPRQPHLGQELLDRQRRCRPLACSLSFGAEPRRDCFGVRPAATGCMPTPSFPSGAWIVAVIGDDIEAVTAFNDVSHDEVIGR